MFHRQQLIDLKEEAEAEATKVTNPSWARAYLRLADAADHLGAKRARCEERIEEPTKIS